MRSGHDRFFLRCLNCKQGYSPNEVTYFCPTCELSGALDIVFDYEHFRQKLRKSDLSRRPFDMWRYRELLPVDIAFAPRLHTGGSPLYRLSARVNGQVWIKDDSRMPSGSLKDRASALAVALAASQNVRTIAVASTGNAAAALSCMCAGSGIRSVIFAPTTVAREKLAQILAYGAEVIKIEGGYDEAFAACHAACKEHGWYNRSTGLNSYMSEGKKTAAFEICEQLNWQAPDRVFVPVGNGCIVGSVYKGFYELLQMGWIDHMPKIMGVQAEGSNYMYRAWTLRAGFDQVPQRPSGTVATSISVALPRDRIKALRAIEASGGAFICVDDEQIFSALIDLAQTYGVFAEPGAAAAYAGLLRYTELADDDVSVLLLTGSGLKDISGLLKSGALHNSLRKSVSPEPAPSRLPFH